MNLENGEIQIFTGNSNKSLVTKICECLGVEEGHCVVNKFSDGEIQLDIN